MTREEKMVDGLRSIVKGLVDQNVEAGRIDERSAKIAYVRWGLGGECLTLDQTGLLFNITRERVRQIEIQVRSELANTRLAEERLVRERAAAMSKEIAMLKTDLAEARRDLGEVRHIVGRW